jgi:hypothetical protein
VSRTHVRRFYPPCRALGQLAPGFVQWVSRPAQSPAYTGVGGKIQLTESQKLSCSVLKIEHSVLAASSVSAHSDSPENHNVVRNDDFATRSLDGLLWTSRHRRDESRVDQGNDKPVEITISDDAKARSWLAQSVMSRYPTSDHHRKRHCHCGPQDIRKRERMRVHRLAVHGAASPGSGRTGIESDVEPGVAFVAPSPNCAPAPAIHRGQENFTWTFIQI